MMRLCRCCGFRGVLGADCGGFPAGRIRFCGEGFAVEIGFAAAFRSQLAWRAQLAGRGSWQASFAFAGRGFCAWTTSLAL